MEVQSGKELSEGWQREVQQAMVKDKW